MGGPDGLGVLLHQVLQTVLLHEHRLALLKIAHLFRPALRLPCTSAVSFWTVHDGLAAEPPITIAYLRSGWSITVIFSVEGARVFNPFVILSPMSGNLVPFGLRLRCLCAIFGRGSSWPVPV